MRARRRPARRSWFARNHEWLALAVVLAPMVHWSFKPPKSWIEDDLFTTRAVADVQYLAWAARDFHGAHGRWPAHDELLAADPSLAREDRWRHAFRYEWTPEGLVVASAGVDGAWTTADDVRSDPVPAPARDAATAASPCR